MTFHLTDKSQVLYNWYNINPSQEVYSLENIFYKISKLLFDKLANVDVWQHLSEYSKIGVWAFGSVQAKCKQHHIVK